MIFSAWIRMLRKATLIQMRRKRVIRVCAIFISKILESIRERCICSCMVLARRGSVLSLRSRDWQMSWTAWMEARRGKMWSSWSPLSEESRDWSTWCAPLPRLTSPETHRYHNKRVTTKTSTAQTHRLRQKPLEAAWCVP